MPPRHVAWLRDRVERLRRGCPLTFLAHEIPTCDAASVTFAVSAAGEGRIDGGRHPAYVDAAACIATAALARGID